MNPQFYSQTPLNTMSSFLTQPNPSLTDLDSLCLQPYFLTPSELLALQAQAQKPGQMPGSITQVLPDIKAEIPVKMEGKREYLPKIAKLEQFDQNLSLNGSDITTPSCTDQLLTQTDLKTEIEKVVRFLFGSMGKGDESLIMNMRGYYLHNATLLEVFDKLSMRFYSKKKCKEDLIRYILRKIFRHLRTSIMTKEKVTSKKASLLICKRYFQRGEVPSEVEDEEKFLESLLPYNKNSKNKTMNITFILEIFSSPSFYKEYLEFLPELNRLIIDENKQKEEKLVSFILECIQKKCLKKLTTVYRMPWLDVWKEDAKNLAIAIMPNKRLIYNDQRPKN